MTPSPLEAAAQFSSGRGALAVKPLGNGLINDTYLAREDGIGFVLQRINAQVFPEPRQVMHNLAQLNRHIDQKEPASVRLKIPKILCTGHDESYYQDADQQIWRALELIENTESRERLQNPGEAEQVGAALGHFHRLCADLPADALYDTLPGFHITPAYLAQYDQILQSSSTSANDQDLLRCQAFIAAHRREADVLENAKICGKLHDRVIHGDPKLNNFLFEQDGERIVSLIDLDTVKPGLVHYDIGDCLRSCCHDRETQTFNLVFGKIILDSYLREAGEFFTSHDYDYLYPAIWLIPFELGLRFFTDYLNGDRYFKTTAPRQNLARALEQFALCLSIEQQQDALKTYIADLKAKHTA